MKIVRARPPNYDAIDAKFNIRGQQVVFAYGDTIYVPSGSLDVPPQIVAHEKVHSARQLAYGIGVEEWWKRYIADIDFRREEEQLAHIAEYRHLCDHAGGRNQRRRHLSIVATKLSHPLYGPLMNKTAARKVLEDGDNPY